MFVQNKWVKLAIVPLMAALVLSGCGKDEGKKAGMKGF